MNNLDPAVPNDWISSIKEASIYSIEEWNKFKSMLEGRIKIYIDERKDSPQQHQALLACVGTSFVHKFYPEGNFFNPFFINCCISDYR